MFRVGCRGPPRVRSQRAAMETELYEVNERLEITQDRIDGGSHTYARVELLDDAAARIARSRRAAEAAPLHPQTRTNTTRAAVAQAATTATTAHTATARAVLLRGGYRSYPCISDRDSSRVTKPRIE